MLQWQARPPWKHRYSILILLFCAYLLCYIDRIVMASAIPFIAKDFHLSTLVMGEVLSAFFIGYALMQIPGGLLADRFGPRAVLTCSLVWWSVLTAATGTATSLVSLLVIRVLFGAGEGPFPASSSKALSIWFPLREVGRANGLQLTSAAIAATLAPLFVVALIANWGWRSVFYTLLIPGLVLAPAIWSRVTNRPAENQRVSREEIAEYEANAVQQVSARVSLTQSLRTPAVLWTASCAFFVNMVSWGLINWVPTYLLRARGVSLREMGALAALMGLAGALGYFLGGYLFDKHFRQTLRLPIVLSVLASGGFAWLAASASSGNWSVVCLLAAYLFISIAGVTIFTLPLVVVPKHAVGGAFGIVNTAGQLAGVLSPLLIGYVLKLTDGKFEPVFTCLGALALLALYPALRIRTPAMAYE
jgi:sugar phosphate permease